MVIMVFDNGGNLITSLTYDRSKFTSTPSGVRKFSADVVIGAKYFPADGLPSTAVQVYVDVPPGGAKYIHRAQVKEAIAKTKDLPGVRFELVPEWYAINYDVSDGRTYVWAK